jgi:ADP-heptose:LPS heptosyltransferase
VLPIKRKFTSAIWRLKQVVGASYDGAIKYFVSICTSRYWLLDYLPAFRNRRPSLLLVRIDLIGDFILWLDSAQAYKKLYPKHKITLAVNSACIELAQTLPYWDEVISIDVSRLRSNELYRLTVLTKLRIACFSLALQPTYSREWVGDMMIRATAAKQRIGYFGDLNNIQEHCKTLADRWYTHLIANSTTATMELNINAHFVRELGAHEFLSSVSLIESTPSRLFNLQVDRGYLVVAPGASWQPKMWPINHFAELLQRLSKRFDLQIVLCGGPSDQALCRQLEALVSNHQVINLAGQTTLLELIEIIRSAKLLVTNDSAPVHISAATQTPSVCLLGGGHYGRFLPYTPEQVVDTVTPVVVTHPMPCFNCSWKCHYKLAQGSAVPCIADISVASVYDLCVDALSQSQTI